MQVQTALVIHCS